MAQKKVYDKEFKIQAVKLGREIGFSKAAKELGVNVDTLYGSYRGGPETPAAKQGAGERNCTLKGRE